MGLSSVCLLVVRLSWLLSHPIELQVSAVCFWQQNYSNVLFSVHVIHDRTNIELKFNMYLSLLNYECFLIHSK